MGATTPDEITRAAAGMNIHDLVRELTASAGTTAVQTMAGISDRTAPLEWATPDGPEPGPDAEVRLRLGYRVWRTLQVTEGRSVALAWLVGANPRLGGDLPVLAVQTGRAREVLGAAEAFVDDVFAA